MKTHIISIGVSRHQDAQNSLEFAAKDAKDFFELVKNNVPNLGVTKILVDSEASLARIQSAIGNVLSSQILEEDNLIIFFSGHGAIDALSGENESSYYLIPFDVVSGDIQNTSLSVDYVKSALEKIRCKTKLLFLDTCFSGSYNSKAYPTQKTKALPEKTKTFSEINGAGEVVFTACSENEQAIEDSENRNGLFTHYLLAEIQGHTKDPFPIEAIFSPISEKVLARAQSKFHRKQTPTWHGKVVGGIQLPPFPNKIRVKPEFIETPEITSSEIGTVPDVEFEITSKEKGELIKKIIGFISATVGDDKISEVQFEKFCSKLLAKLKKKWEEIFPSLNEVGKIPEAVAQIEAESYQLISLGILLSVFGTDKQLKIYSEYVGQILTWAKHRAGLVAAISIPEIIVAEIIYAFGIVAMTRGNLKPWSILLNSKIVIDYSKAPLPLFAHNEVHYCDALGGNAITVGKHIEDHLKGIDWLEDFCPKLNMDGDLTDYFCRANFLLVMLLIKHGERIYGLFGRYYAERIMPVVNKINFDDDFRRQVAAFLGEKPEEVFEFIKKQTSEMRASDGFRGGFDWESVSERSFNFSE